MGSNTIGVMVQLKSLIPLVEEVAGSIGERVGIGVGWDQDTVMQSAKRLRDGGARAIVARGPWPQKITAETGLPVFDYNPGSHDFLQAFSKARQISKIVGVIDAYAFEEDWETFEDALGITILVSPHLEETSELERYVKQLYRAGARVMVGGQLTLRQADALGIPAIYLESGPHALRLALLKARAFIQGIEAEKERAQILQTVLDGIQEGIVAFRPDGRVIAANKVAGGLTGRSEIVPGSHLSELSQWWKDAVGVLESSHPVTDRIAAFNGRKVVCDVTPIKVRDVVTSGVAVIQDFGKVRKTEEAIRKNLYGRGFTARHTFNDIVAESAEMKRAIEMAKRYAKSNLTVLLTGETGTGKEMVAQSIHHESDRSGGPFVAVNCAALPENLLESELFGYEEGAFTGARKGGKPGLFEMAHGGTIFLDEITSMTSAMQAKLLRVLEEQSVVHVGGDRVIHLNVRLISASNVDLESVVEAGRFREDLFFRLAVLVLKIPPLRERKGDIAPLLKHFLGETGYVQDIIAELEKRDWPGNVRQLENFAQRYLAFLETGQAPLDAANAALGDKKSTKSGSDGSIISISPGRLDEMTKELLRQIVSKHTGGIGPLAARLGMSKSGLWKMLKRYGITTNNC